MLCVHIFSWISRIQRLMSSNSDTNASRMLPHEMKPELEKAVRETLVAEPDIRGSIERSDPKNPRSNLMVCIIIELMNIGLSLGGSSREGGLYSIRKSVFLPRLSCSTLLPQPKLLILNHAFIP